MIKASFIAYIDESGDEGFKFAPPGSDKGSSEWFVVAAVVARAKSELTTMQLVDKVRIRIGKQPKAELHFRDLQHHHRLVLVSEIGAAPLRWIAVAIHKPSLQQLQRQHLYFYACRFLIERVSWLCEKKALPGEGDGTVDIVFSNRGQMSYADFRGYLGKLVEREDVKVSPNVIKPDQVTALVARSRMGLQVVDAVASGIWYALSPRCGVTEDRYARELRPRCFASDDGRASSYGLKLFPDCLELPDDVQPRLEWAREHYALPRKK